MVGQVSPSSPLLSSTRFLPLLSQQELYGHRKELDGMAPIEGIGPEIEIFLIF